MILVPFRSCYKKRTLVDTLYVNVIILIIVSVQCVFQPGHGWVRGGYTCQCKPGYYSATTKNMFNGSLVEVTRTIFIEQKFISNFRLPTMTPTYRPPLPTQCCTCACHVQLDVTPALMTPPVQHSTVGQSDSSFSLSPSSVPSPALSPSSLSSTTGRSRCSNTPVQHFSV